VLVLSELLDLSQRMPAAVNDNYPKKEELE